MCIKVCIKVCFCYKLNFFCELSSALSWKHSLIHTLILRIKVKTMNPSLKEQFESRHQELLIGRKNYEESVKLHVFKKVSDPNSYKLSGDGKSLIAEFSCDFNDPNAEYFEEAADHFGFHYENMEIGICKISIHFK